MYGVCRIHTARLNESHDMVWVNFKVEERNSSSARPKLSYFWHLQIVVAGIGRRTTPGSNTGHSRRHALVWQGATEQKQIRALCRDLTPIFVLQHHVAVESDRVLASQRRRAQFNPTRDGLQMQMFDNQTSNMFEVYADILYVLPF